MIKNFLGALIIVFASCGVSWATCPAPPAGCTIDQMNAGAAVSPTDIFPAFQGASPAMGVTAAQLKTFIGCANANCPITGLNFNGGTTTVGNTVTGAASELLFHNNAVGQNVATIQNDAGISGISYLLPSSFGTIAGTAFGYTSNNQASPFNSTAYWEISWYDYALGAASTHAPVDGKIVQTGYVASNAIATFGSITGGSGYTNGTYSSVPLTGGSGGGAIATVVVSGGAVTSVTLVRGGVSATIGGANYANADSLSANASSIGGAGSGFSIPVTSVGSAYGNYPKVEFTSDGITTFLHRLDGIAPYPMVVNAVTGFVAHNAPVSQAPLAPLDVYGTILAGNGNAANRALGVAPLNVVDPNNPIFYSVHQGFNTMKMDWKTSPNRVAVSDGNASADVLAFYMDGSKTVSMPNISSDATHTDTTVCEDTTTHQFYAGSGTLGVCLGTSSSRFKHDIRPLDAGLEQVMNLEPVAYRLNADHGDPNKLLYGFTAEQGAKVLPALAGPDSEGNPNTFDYLGVVPVLVKAMQQLKAENDNLRACSDSWKCRLFGMR